MFCFCSSHAMRPHPAAGPFGPMIPPCPVLRFVPAPPPGRVLRRAMRDFTGFLALAWALAEIALWAGGA